MTHPLTPRENLTRPIVGIENRTAQEVFDIMSDRFRAHLTALASGSGDHAELARLAEAATPGPWSAADWDDDFGENRFTVQATEPEKISPGQSSIWPDGIRCLRVAETMEGERPAEDAAFIAAANPATVLALLAENAALRAESENARTVVAWANNSLFGSCGYFHGEPFDGLHLARPIEALKEQATEAERKLAEARSMLLRWRRHAPTEALEDLTDAWLSKEAERG